MADFNQPQNTTLVTLVLQYVRDSIINLAKMLDGTTDTNIPDGAKRYNSTNAKFEVYSAGTWSTLGFHTPIDSHIANSALHQPVIPGSMVFWPGAAIPSGYLACQGQAVSRTTYAALYAALGGASSPWGQGDGSTTFNVPDMRERFPLGRGTSGSYTAMAGSGGVMDHVHTVAAHTHSVGAHTHPNTHNHALNDHTHTGPAHTHSIPAHHHDTRASGATINITASGSHAHQVNPTTTNVYVSHNGVNNDGSIGPGANASLLNITTGSATHTHPNTAFSGKVGNVAGGVNGDAAMTSGSAGNSATSGVNGGPGSTQNYTGATGSSTAFNTSSDGGGNTGTANPPYRLGDWIIKT